MAQLSCQLFSLAGCSAEHCRVCMPWGSSAHLNALLQLLSVGLGSFQVRRRDRQLRRQRGHLGRMGVRIASPSCGQLPLDVRSLPLRLILGLPCCRQLGHEVHSCRLLPGSRLFCCRQLGL